jgi:hypothetical protein
MEAMLLIYARTITFTIGRTITFTIKCAITFAIGRTVKFTIERTVVCLSLGVQCSVPAGW